MHRFEEVSIHQWESCHSGKEHRGERVCRLGRVFEKRLTEVEVEVEPDLGGYLIPLELQDPLEGASTHEGLRSGDI